MFVAFTKHCWQKQGLLSVQQQLEAFCIHLQVHGHLNGSFCHIKAVATLQQAEAQTQAGMVQQNCICRTCEI